MTRHKYAKHLGYLFRFLVKQGAMDRDLSKEVKLPRLVEQAPKSMSPADVDHLVEGILGYKKQRMDNWRVPDYTWLARIVQANVYLGLRLGEVIHQRWEHVDLKRRTLAVRNTEEFTPKRVIPIPQPALTVLRQIEQERGELPYVFTSHLGRLKLHYLSHTKSG